LQSKRSLALSCPGLAMMAIFVTSAGGQDMRDRQRARCCIAWQEMVGTVLKRLDEGELTPDFGRAHDKFLDAGCLSPVPACPKSTAGFVFADRLEWRETPLGRRSCRRWQERLHEG
jgi:hypothetical protein